MPVLPLVGSTITLLPGVSKPSFSASRTMLTAMRSLTLYPGWNASSFASTVAFAPSVTRFSRTSGVRPINSVASFAHAIGHLSLCLSWLATLLDMILWFPPLRQILMLGQFLAAQHQQFRRLGRSEERRVGKECRSR